MTHIEELLFKEQEDKYGDFISSLTPSVDRKFIIGVRVPKIRNIAKEISKEEQAEFIKKLPHKYYEENLLHGFILSKIKSFDAAIKEVENFLPYVDNWAVSDTMMPKVFAKNKKDLLKHIDVWLKSGHTYKMRFAIDMYMNLFLDSDFDAKHLDIIGNVQSDEYYVKMMQAWYFATALAKQYDSSIKIIESKKLEKWVHNKSIQKAIESNRITNEQKEYLKTLKIK